MAIGLLYHTALCFMYCTYPYVICTVHVQYLSIYRGNDLAFIIVYDIFESKRRLPSWFNCDSGIMMY